MTRFRDTHPYQHDDLSDEAPLPRDVLDALPVGRVIEVNMVQTLVRWRKEQSRQVGRRFDDPPPVRWQRLDAWSALRAGRPVEGDGEPVGPLITTDDLCDALRGHVFTYRVLP